MEILAVSGSLLRGNQQATGPVGQDGAPIVFFYGSRSGTDAFDTSHPGRQDIGGYGCRTYRTQVPIRDLRERVPRYDGF